MRNTSVLIVTVGWRCVGNSIFLIGPSAKIDVFAAIRTKRTKFVFFDPSNGFFTTGAGNNSHAPILKPTQRELERNVSRRYAGAANTLKLRALIQKTHVHGVLVGADFRHHRMPRLDCDAGQ